jgi:hypothetical protein
MLPGARLSVFGAAQVRDEHDPRAASAQLVDRGKRCADSHVVGDLAIVERDVEVDADEHALAVQVAEIGEGSHSSFCTSSTMRLE